MQNGTSFDAHEQTRLAFAWSILSPVHRTGSWKGRIEIGASTAAIKALETIGMGVDVLAEACEFYTATSLRVEPGEVPGAVRLVADGYAAGPAGDH